MLYFVCPTVQRPSGGVEKVYQFVESLERVGVPAAVVLRGLSTAKHDWFESDATCVSAEQVAFDVDADVLVVPDLSAFALDLPADARFVVLHQTPYRTFEGCRVRSGEQPTARDLGPYDHPGLLAVVCVSSDSERFFRFTFPGLDVRRIHLGIDPTCFRPGDTWRAPALACMPRKRPDAVSQLFYMLGSRGNCPGWPPRLIDNIPQHEVAAALRASPVFLNLPRPAEGFGLPALEAMASGSLVVGYTGRGGDEYLRPEHAFPVPEGDAIKFVRTIEAVIEEYEGRSSRLVAMREAALDLVRSEYTPERQHRDVVDVFTSLAPSQSQPTTKRSPKVPMTSILAVPAAPSRARVVAHHLRAAWRGVRRPKGR